MRFDRVCVETKRRIEEREASGRQVAKRCGDTRSRKGALAKTPEQFKDLNDWTRAGATTKDLVAAMGNAEIVRGAETVESVTESSPNESTEPGPFPLDALNPAMREIVEQSAEVYQIKPELPAMAGVATLSGAIGKTSVIRGAVSGRDTHCNLYVIPGAPKSYGKNAAATMARRCVRRPMNRNILSSNRKAEPSYRKEGFRKTRATAREELRQARDDRMRASNKAGGTRENSEAA